MVMLIVSFITNVNERWMAITKARSVLLLFKMSTQRQSYMLEFQLKTIEGNVAVFLWVKQARAMGTPISGALIMAKADSLAEKLNICDFKANRSWLYRFKIRRPLIYKTICGESASVTPEMTREWRSNTLPTLLTRYSNDDVNKCSSGQVQIIRLSGFESLQNGHLYPQMDH